MVTGRSSGQGWTTTRTGDGWQQAAKLTPEDGQPAQTFGSAVTLEAETAFINAPNHTDRSGIDEGAVYVFERQQDGWREQTNLAPNDEDQCDRFGTTVALGAEAAVIGAPNDGGSSSGSAWIYERTPTGWDLQTKLVAEDGDDGDLFSSGVAVEGDTIVIGAMGDEDPNGSYAGAAYVFERRNGEWHQHTKLAPSDVGSGASFGRAAAITDDTILIGADEATVEGTRSGAAYVYER